jgi:hypothetical protein
MEVVVLKNNMNKGFSTLYIVIILGSIALGLVIMLSTNSFLFAKNAVDVKSSNQAKSLVNGCAEVVIEMMRENNSYVGSGSVNIGPNICNYTIINTGGTTRSIFLSGQVNTVVRKLQINTTAFNKIKVSFWQEVE